MSLRASTYYIKDMQEKDDDNVQRAIKFAEFVEINEYSEIDIKIDDNWQVGECSSDNQKELESEYNGQDNFGKLKQIDKYLTSKNHKDGKSMIELIEECKAKNTCYETLMNTFKNLSPVTDLCYKNSADISDKEELKDNKDMKEPIINTQLSGICNKESMINSSSKFIIEKRVNSTKVNFNKCEKLKKPENLNSYQKNSLSTYSEIYKKCKPMKKAFGKEKFRNCSKNGSKKNLFENFNTEDNDSTKNKINSEFKPIKLHFDKLFKYNQVKTSTNKPKQKLTITTASCNPSAINIKLKKGLFSFVQFSKCHERKKRNHPNMKLSTEQTKNRLHESSINQPFFKFSTISKRETIVVRSNTKAFPTKIFRTKESTPYRRFSKNICNSIEESHCEFKR